MLKIKKTAVFMLIAAFLLARLGGWEIPHQIYYTVAGVMIVSFLWSGSITKKINAYQRLEQRDYYVDDTLEITSFVDNDSFLPIPHIEIVDRTEEAIRGEKSKPSIVSLFPTEREIVRNNIVAKYRGIYQLGPIDVEISDALGIVTRRHTIYSNTSFKVYPRIYNLENLNLKSMQSYGTVSTKQKAYEDNTSVSDIRKYAPGDSIKRIHWKVSAKKNNLLVKNYEMTGSAAAYIFLDFKRNGFRGDNSRDLEERAVETTTSIISYMLKNAVSIEMFINSSMAHYAKGRDIKELKNFMDILCEIKTDGTKTMKDVLEKRIRLLSKGSSIIVITGNVNEEEARMYGSIKSMGYEVILIHVSDYGIDDYIRGILDNYYVKTCSIKTDSSIKGVLESL